MIFKTYMLGEIASNTSRRFNFDDNKKVCFINTGDVWKGDFLIKECVQSKGLPGQAKKAIQHGDILYSEIRPGNKRYLLVEGNVADYVVSTKFMVITCNQDIVLPEYLYLVLTNKKCEVDFKAIAESRSGTFPQITFDAIAYYPIELPMLAEQRKIVVVIQSIIHKLNANKKVNSILEEIAQTIFKSWFIDFDPVKAKMEGKQPEGMDEETAALFPDKLVDSELGLIPEGWKIKSINSFGKVICGKTPSKKNINFYGGDVPFIKIPDTHGKVFVTKTTETLTQAGDESQLKKRIPANSICVSCIATVGQVFITTRLSHTNQQINSVLPYNHNLLYYLLFNFKRLNQHFHDLASGGSATLNMNTRTFSNIELVYPALDIMEAFHNIIDGLMQRILINQLESETLMDVRDALLPKLLSGEIRLDNISDE